MNGCGDRPTTTSAHLVATSSTIQYHWFTPWTLAGPLSAIRAALKRRATTSAFSVQLAIQVAPVRTDLPDDPTTSGSPVTGAGETLVGVSDLTSTLTGKYWVRFGVAYSSTSGVAQADVYFTPSFEGCGQQLAAQVIEANSSSTTGVVVPVGAWVPALSVTKLKAAFVVTTMGSGFQCRLIWRFAATSPEAPGGWTTTDSFRGAGEACTTELTATSATDMWIQPGVEYGLSANGFGGGIIAVSVVSKK